MNTPSKWERLKIINIGDIHLGHPDTRTNHIITNLMRELSPDVLGDVDLLLINGDTFDHLLDHSDPQTREINLWISKLLNDCAKADVTVVILKGTPSHDWDQSEWFTHVATSQQIPVQLFYVDKLDILYLDRWGLNMLCVPDEWRSTPEETWLEVLDLLKVKGLTSVDIGLMHGYFPPQLPPEMAYGAHSIENYTSIVDYYIVIGHIHHHWRYDIIVAPSSFDRLRHGEEDPKGLVITTIVNGKPELTQHDFVENRGARLYKTVDVRGMDVDKATDAIEVMAKSLPPLSAIRILCDRGSPLRASLPHWRESFSTLTWTLTAKTQKVGDVNTGQLVVSQTQRELVQMVTIDKSNIVDLMAKRLELMYPETAHETTSVLQEIVNSD